MMDHLPEGRLPAEMLKELFGALSSTDLHVIVAPIIGRDAAGLSVNSKALAISSNTLAFDKDYLAPYGFALALNEVVCLGAKPRWCQFNILLPVGTTKSDLLFLREQIVQEMNRYGLQSVGCQIEVTNAIQKPLINVQIIGMPVGKTLLNPMNSNPGDKILLWQKVPLEGVARVAYERYQELVPYFLKEELDAMVSWFDNPGFCVAPAVERIVPTEGLVSLHVPGSGGLANLLHHMAEAAQCGMKVNFDSIAFLPEIEKLSKLLAFNPMGLFAGGCLVIVVRPGAVEPIQEKLYEESLTLIGEYTEEKDRLLIRQGKREPLPYFTQDEYFNASKVSLSFIEGPSISS